MKKIKNTASAAFLIAACGFVFSGCAGKATRSGGSLTPPGAGVSLAGAAAYRGGDYKMALDKFVEALVLDRRADMREAEAQDLVNAGRASISLGDYRGAEPYLYDAIELCRRIKDNSNLSEAHATLAKGLYLSGRVEEARASMEKTLQIDSEFGYKSGARLNLHGLILIDSGETERAEEVIKRAMELNKEEKNAPEAANSLRAFAVLRGLQGRPDEALKYYKDAYIIDSSLGDSRKIAYGLSSMARLELNGGRLLDAVFLFERAYIVDISSGDAAGAIQALDQIIEVYRELGDRGKELEYKKIKEGISSGAEGKEKAK